MLFRGAELFWLLDEMDDDNDDATDCGDLLLFLVLLFWLPIEFALNPLLLPTMEHVEEAIEVGDVSNDRDVELEWTLDEWAPPVDDDEVDNLARDMFASVVKPQFGSTSKARLPI